MTRCPTCYRPLDATHRLLGRCLLPEPPRIRPATTQRGYVPPSRSHRVPRDEYLASVRVERTEEERRASARERQRRYRARRAA